MTDRSIGDNQPDGTESLTAQLARDYGHIEDKTKALLDEARELPSLVSDDADSEKIALVIRKLRDHGKQVEATRQAEKEPYLRNGQAVDGWFGDRLARTKKAMDILHARINAWQQEKLAEEQARRREEERRLLAEAQALEAQMRAARAEKRKKELELEMKGAQQAAAMAAMKADESAADMTRTRHESGAMTTMARDPVVSVIDYDLIPLDKLRPYISRNEIERAVKAWARATSHQETMAGVSIEIGHKTVVR